MIEFAIPLKPIYLLGYGLIGLIALGVWHWLHLCKRSRPHIVAGMISSRPQGEFLLDENRERDFRLYGGFVVTGISTALAVCGFAFWLTRL